MRAAPPRGVGLPVGRRGGRSHCGWIEKRGGGTSRLGSKKYKRRWFELVADPASPGRCVLTYRESTADMLLKGLIQLEDAELLDGVDREGLDFSINAGRQRIYV